MENNDKCDNCNKADQATADHLGEQWCLDCMRLAGHCISCDANIHDMVEDYFNYEDDRCPNCITHSNNK
jgi:hypothetical protein